MIKPGNLFFKIKLSYSTNYGYSKSPDMTSMRKILIAEDELVLQLMLKHMLQKMGFSNIVAVERGRDVIDVCTNNDFDLILMDIILLDDIDGIEAYGRVKMRKKIPVIYITGNTDPRNRIRAEKFGYVEYLAKPVTYVQLNSIIKDLFES